MKTINPAILERLFGRLVIGFVAAGFLILAAVAVSGILVMQQLLVFTDLVTHTHEVQQAVSDYRIANERLETARRGYLLSRDGRFRTTYDDASAELDRALGDIQRLTIDNPDQQARVGQLRRLQAEQRAAAIGSIRAVDAGTQAAIDFSLDDGVLRTREIRALTRDMAQEEQQLLDARAASREVSLERLVGVAIVAGVILALVGLGSLWVILRFTRDLATSRNALRRLNEGLEETVRGRTADLQRANDEIQRFAYIVSHDLRSPLVNVMGFTSELESSIRPLAEMLERAEAEAPGIVTPDARAAVREDLPEAVGFIRASTQKMDRLINAILRLSREGRRVLTPEPLDMRQLLAGIAGSLQHRIDDLGAKVEVAPDLPNLVSDRVALEQVFSNLVENALKYLKPGRPGRIVVSGKVEGERVIYEVVDNGRGIDPKDHERIFDLFRRSGVQDQPGEGIGLAHVRALIYRLGGFIGCDSVLDQGATFRVSLPARMVAEESGV